MQSIQVGREIQLFAILGLDYWNPSPAISTDGIELSVCFGAVGKMIAHISKPKKEIQIVFFFFNEKRSTAIFPRLLVLRAVRGQDIGSQE